MKPFREVKLPSGAVLKVQAAPFAEAKTLFQAIMAEARGVSIGEQQDMGNLLKTVLMTAFCSPAIELALAICLARCVYNKGRPGAGDLKIDKDTFEDHEAREDYVLVCMEVAEENISPFLKSLYVVWSRGLATIERARK